MNSASAGRFKILLVEDSLEEGFLVRALVEAEGLGEVVVAQDGLQGIALVRDGTFDLVVCDLNLPGCDGEEVIAESLAEYPERPVIVTTAHADTGLHARAVESGADRILTKPLDRTAFLEALWALLSNGKAGAPAVCAVLAIAAFPGDAEMGCGGILAGLARDGRAGLILTLTSRLGSGADLSLASMEAGRHLGLQTVLGRLESVDPERSSDLIRDAVDQYQPETLIVPSPRDRSADRVVVHRAALLAAPEVPHVYGYQSPTATPEFRPNLFATVEGVMERKLKALACFEAIGAGAHLDRSLVQATARYWSRFSRHREVEPLELLRGPAAESGEKRASVERPKSRTEAA